MYTPIGQGKLEVEFGGSKNLSVQGARCYSEGWDMGYDDVGWSVLIP